MSNKLSKILLASASIATVSIIASILYKKMIAQVYDEKKTNYITLPQYSAKEDSTLAAIKAAGEDESDIDE